MAGGTSGDRQYYSSAWWKEYLAFGTAIDLLADGPGTNPPGAASGSAGTRPCRRIRVGSAGNLALLRPDGTAITTTGLVAGEVLDVQAIGIVVAGTTITNCTVY